MAKAKKSPKEAKAAPRAQEAATGLLDEKEVGIAPEGFQEVSGERVTGWFAVQAGNAIQGILRDVFETKSKFSGRDGSNKKRVYKIEVTSAAPSKAGPTLYNSSDEDKADELQQAEVGDLIGVDEKGWLQSLKKVLVGQEVWIACMGKQPPSAEYPQGAWIYRVLAKPVRVNEVTGEVTS
jgi:hypothetical protein